MLTLLGYAALAAGLLLCAYLTLTLMVALVAIGFVLKGRARIPLGAFRPPMYDVIDKAVQGLLLAWLSPTAYLYMLVIVWFAKLDDEPSEGRWPGLGTFVRRPHLPEWAAFADTPDERGFGLYEPAVMAIYLKYGWRVCLYYWLGVRNQLYGLAWAWGKPAYAPIDLNKPTPTGWRIDGELWQFEQVIGSYRILLGHKVYSNPYGFGTGSPYWAVPMLTIKKAIPS